MTVSELNRNQLISLKQAYLTKLFINPSWGDLADADNIISDLEIFEEYEGFVFTEEDF